MSAFTTRSGIELGAIAESRRGQVRLSVIAEGCAPTDGKGTSMVFLDHADARRLGWKLIRAAREVEEPTGDVSHTVVQ